MFVHTTFSGTVRVLILAAPLGCFSPTGSVESSTGTTEPSDTGAMATAQTAETGDTSTTQLTTDLTSTSTSAGTSSTSGTAVCGDGQLDDGEECDDGNRADTDGCAGDCVKEFRRVFTTSMVFTGALGGIEGADAKCQAAAKSVQLPGTFRAWLSAKDSSPATTFVKSKVPYLRLDDVKVADDWSDLVDGKLQANLSVSELKGLPGLGTHPCEPSDTRVVWTNTKEDGNAYEPMPCGDWTGGQGMALAGHAGVFLTFGWTQTCSPGCSDQAALYCFEQ